MTAALLTTRVEDASLVADGGPARLAFQGLPRATEIAAAVAAARGVYRWAEGRLVVTAVPARLVDAAGRVGGEPLAALVRDASARALEAWRGAPPDVSTSAGDLPTSRRPVVMGIVNVTPDSFSDGGRAYDPTDHPRLAVAAGEALLAADADVLDVGGESSRPGADPVGAEEELARVVPVIEALAATGAVVSVDTTKAVVARRAVEAGAAIVNDISAGRLDPELLRVVAELDVPYVLTHMQGTPKTMQHEPRYDDVVAEVFDELAAGVEELRSLGLSASRIVIDPGIGFGKRVGHNLTLLRRLRELTSLGRPVMVGTSRKSFVARVTGAEEPEERLEGSVVSAAAAVANGARLVRVHDVASTVRAVRMAHAIACADGDDRPVPTAAAAAAE